MSTQSEALALAKRATIYLYQTDPEFVIGGCSDVSEIIAAWLQTKGYAVRPVYGVARYGKLRGFLHSWLDIEGRIFDPVLWVQGRKMEKYAYREEPDAAKALRCDIETILEGQVEELDRVIG